MFEHQHPGEQLQPFEVQSLKWEDIICDFIVVLSRTKNGNVAI